MKLTMMLADSAQAVEGKLYILGGGWSITGPEPNPMAVAIKVDVPWDQANQRREFKLALSDEDGQPFIVPTPTGERPIEIIGQFEVGRPPGLKPGTTLDFALAINLGPLPLRPDTAYVWRFYVDGETKDDWRLGFTTRPAKPT